MANRGYHGAGDSVKACVPGTYKKVDLSEAVCDNCPESTFSDVAQAISDSTCEDCPDFSSSPTGSSAASHCRCSKGYTGEVTGSQTGNSSDRCAICEMGKFKGTEGNTPCISCPSSSNTTGQAETSASGCLCQIGFFGTIFGEDSASGACFPCLDQLYSDVAGLSECKECTPNTWWTDGSACRAHVGAPVSLDLNASDFPEIDYGGG